jgi:chromosome segregation protein
LEKLLRVSLSGKYRLLERDAAQTAIELNLAAGELKSLSEQVAEREQSHEQRQLACYELEEQLTAARQRLAQLNVEAERTRGRLASQVKESGAIEERITQAEKETQQLGARLTGLEGEIAAQKQTVSALEAEIAEARNRMLEINQQRVSLHSKLVLL